jgi:predicted DCC family thiol-disulfide oxidoreductase YuxK
MMTPQTERAIILFDGVCNLCNGFVNFVIDRDPEEVFRFAALQSEAAKTLLQAHGVTVDADAPENLLQSVILIENEQVYRRSTAALRIARHLALPWPLLYGLIAVPTPIRDAIYDRIAARRYAWFGQRDQCRVPTPDLRDRFLDSEAAD